MTVRSLNTVCCAGGILKYRKKERRRPALAVFGGLDRKRTRTSSTSNSSPSLAMAGGSGDGGTTPQEKSSSSPALLGLAGDVGTEGTLDQTSTDESSQQTVPPDMDSAQPTIKLNMDAHLGGPLPSGAIAGPPKRSTPALSVLPPSLPNSTAPTLRMPGLGVIPKGVAPNIVAMESRFVAFPPSEIASIIQAALGTERQTPDGDGPLDPPIDVKKLPDEFHLLLIDIRASDVFAKGHCLFSVNVTIPSTLLRRTSFGLEKLLQMLTSDQDRKMFSGITDKTHVVVVDASSERLSGDSPGGLLLQKLAKEANKAKLGWIQGGFAAFSKQVGSRSVGGRCGLGLIIGCVVQHSDLVTAIQPANDPSPQGRRAPTHLPSIVGSGAASARHSPATPSGKSASKPVLTAPAGFFPPHGGPSSEYQTHVDAAPEVLKRMKIFAEETLPALPGRAPEFLKDLLGSGDVKGKISDRFQAIEAAEQKRFQASWRATSPNDPFSVSVGIERGYKNRFTNIWPYNANRVVLREPSQCDYINASFIDVGFHVVLGRAFR